MIAVLGAGTYVIVFAPSKVPGASTSTSTLVEGTTLSTGPTTTETVKTTTPTITTAGLQSNLTYKGTFSYVVPLGPSGINDSSGKPVQWNSTQTASGSFTFSINPTTYLGSGTGQGTITVATHGYCTGSSTVPYTFTILAVLVPTTNNVTIDFGLPNPANVTVQMSCQGSTVGFYTANNPVAYLSVYPNGLDLNSFPANVTGTQTGGFIYTIKIAETS